MVAETGERLPQGLDVHMAYSLEALAAQWNAAPGSGRYLTTDASPGCNLATMHSCTRRRHSAGIGPWSDGAARCFVSRGVPRRPPSN